MMRLSEELLLRSRFRGCLLGVATGDALGAPFEGAALQACAVGLGGDTDTIASMAGARAGAYLGEKAIPSRWRDRLEDADRLVELADSLFLLISRGSGSPVRGNTTP